MSLTNYHLFVGRYDRGLMAPDANHFEVKLNTGNEFYRIAVNVRSQDGSMLMALVNDNYQHELCNRLLESFSENGSYNINDGVKRKQFGLDFLRRNMVGDFNNMVVLPNNAPGLDNDLEDKLTLALNKSKADPNARIFAFGEQWPGTNKPDRYFPEMKDQGLHDIHMNQGNPQGSHDQDNGVFQDGGLLIYFPSLQRWTAILLAFQSQFNTLNPTTLHTDDQTGHRIKGDVPGPGPGTSVDGIVVIVAALVNPKGNEVGKEKVILVNTTDEAISLDGWKLVDRNRHEFVIRNRSIGAGSTAEVTISANSNFNLGNNGGTISLLTSQGIKTSGVQYTKQQAKAEGKLIQF
ncbi:DUF2278 family protein [Spirosoma endbachense]|uniref:DUF2278 family protein n=1 Tax=Spirosoma endbachense TaxID=2666025 RepID=A0A6P1W5T8_9BACT|nr:DUF2278 family protein [Spirosoma endbachense]QHW00704.1 DUF2278 family protein [Spirosoma endbachense]